MAFPPNYNQERNNRAKAKQAKAVEKQNRRDEKSSQRKHEPSELVSPDQNQKDNV